MALGLRYYAELTDPFGEFYRIEILQEKDMVEYIPQAITLTADESPVVIDYKSREKYDVIFSSALTLNIVSELDRQYLDLYHVRYGAVVCKVYKNKKLYWSGVMDTEMYEEPFSYEEDYEVTLTFSDFGGLERKKWNRKGIISVKDAILECIKGTDIKYDEIVEYISTSRNGVASELLLESDYIVCENFYDDGEAMSLKEVLEGILLPYDLHITQRFGKIYIWDWNALYELQTKVIEWDSDDARLTIDKVYNNIRINYKTNEDGKLLSEEVDYDTISSDEEYVYDWAVLGDVYTGISWVDRVIEDQINNNFLNTQAFKLILSGSGDVFTIAPTAKFFKIEPWVSGQKKTGVVWVAKNIDAQQKDIDLTSNSAYQDSCSQLLEVVKQPYICLTSQGEMTKIDVLYSQNIKLALSVEVAIDARYNLFETEFQDNKELEDLANIVYLPVRISLVNSAGVTLYHYYNKVDNPYNNMGIASMSGWKEGEGNWGEAYLAYYDQQERGDKCGCKAFSSNRQMIGWWCEEMPRSYEELGDAEIIPLPPVPGYLKIEIGNKIEIIDYRGKKAGNNNNYKEWTADRYSIIRWLMVTKVELNIRKNNTSYEAEDDTITAFVNEDAVEKLELDTIVGTLAQPSVCSLAQIFDAEMNVNNEYVRAGVSGRLESLLCGTIYSHYADRHNKLSGEVLIQDTLLYSEKNMQGKYAIIAEKQDIYAGTSQIEIVEINQDNFEGEVYE